MAKKKETDVTHGPKVINVVQSQKHKDKRVESMF